MSTRKQGSVTKQRLSRIAVPLKRFSKNRDSVRSSSCADISHNVLSSGIKRARSATPSQTPNRIIQVNHALIFTSEKAPIDDKMWLHSQVVKITSYVKDISGLGVDFLKRGGLKSMTTKQFIIIVSHLLSFAVGNRYKIGANYADDIIKILQQIHYPYNINKSWLKTPTAPHTFCHIIALLSKLLEFSNQETAIQEFEEKNNLIVLEENQNPNFIQLLIKKSKEGYRLWNINQGNDLNIKKILVDEFINTKTEFQNAEGIDLESDRLQTEYNNLLKEGVCIDNLDTFKQIEKSIAKMKVQKQELTEDKENLKTKISKKKELITNKNEVLSELDLEIEKLKEIIEHQQMSVIEKNKIIAENNYNNAILNTIINSIQQLSNAGFPIEINYARFIKKKIDLISKLNNCLFQTEACGVELDVNALKIDFNDKSDLNPKLDLIIQNLDQIKQNIVSADSQYSLKMQDIETKVAEIRYNINTTEQEINSVNKKCDDISELSKEYHESFYKEIKNISKQKVELSDELKLKIELNKNTTVLLDKKNERVEFISNENKKLMKEIQDKLDEFLSVEAKDTEEMEVMCNQLITEYLNLRNES